MNRTDIYGTEINLLTKMKIYCKEISLINKELRKKFPTEQIFVQDKHKIDRAISEYFKAFENLQILALGQDTCRTIFNLK